MKNSSTRLFKLLKIAKKYNIKLSSDDDNIGKVISITRPSKIIKINRQQLRNRVNEILDDGFAHNNSFDTDDDGQILIYTDFFKHKGKDGFYSEPDSNLKLEPDPGPDPEPDPIKLAGEIISINRPRKAKEISQQEFRAIVNKILTDKFNNNDSFDINLNIDAENQIIIYTNIYKHSDSDGLYDKPDPLYTHPLFL